MSSPTETAPETETPAEPTFFQQVRWPIFIVALLGGHATLMMIGVSWAMANASAFAPVESKAPSSSLAKPLSQSQSQSQYHAAPSPPVTPSY